MLEMLKRFDLNTLLALEALLDLQHVSKAAAHMNISQPAMSRTLAKLRESFNDPLLVRINAKHQLSERALGLQGPLKKILADIDDLLQPVSFDPAQCDRTFRIALTDFSAQVFLPEVLHQIYKEAPNVRVEAENLRAGMLTTGTFDGIDVSICNLWLYGPCNLNYQPLLEVPSAVLMSRDHPAAKCELTLQRYLDYSHVEVNLGGQVGTTIDELLKLQGLHRKIGLRTAHVISILPILEKTELFFTTTWQLLGKIGKGYELVCKPVPLELPLAEYSVVWHPKNDNSDANIWFRELLIRVVGENINPH